MIVLYHGTNVEFHAPDVDAGRSGMDFGKGFYLTPNLESARFMAKRVRRLKTVGEEIVLKFAFDEKAAEESGIKTKMFPRIDLEWMHFIIANRDSVWSAVDHNLDRRYDFVHGYVADDKLVNLLHELKRGTMSEEYVLRRLQEVEHQTMQYSIHSQDVADKFLKFVEAIHV